MEDRSASSPASSSLPHASLESSITARDNGAVNAPQLVNCHIEGSVYTTCNINSCQTTAEARQSTLCEASHTGNIILGVCKKLKSNLKVKFERIFEGIAKRGNPALFRDIYTELYVMDGETEGVNREHEVWQIDPVQTRPEQDTPIDCNNIFKSFNQQDLVETTEEKESKRAKREAVRTVLTKGVGGIGKTVSVQKFILDWAEEKANQDIDLLFVLPFRELNSIINKTFSLHELLLNFHSELKEFKDLNSYENCKSLFIFDSLDESKLPFDFFNNQRVSDVSKPASLDELITNIISGNLLPSALVWITSRPAAVDRIAPERIHRMTEVRGFTDLQKEEYFRKKIRDQRLANRIISHVKDVRSLEIMCHIPVFCWIIATVLEKLLKRPERIPSSLTEMYTRFLLIQTNEKKKKYHGTTEKDPLRLSSDDVEIILKLGELAFKKLLERDIVFLEDDLSDNGIDVTEASVKSGVFTEIVREEDPIFPVKNYSFVHLSFQEYLAAFFVFYRFVVEGISFVPETWRSTSSGDGRGWYCKESASMPSDMTPEALDRVHDSHDDNNIAFHFKQMSPQPNQSVNDLHKYTVHHAIRSRSGHLDLFLRFLLGLSIDSIFLKAINLKVENLQVNIPHTKEFIKSLFREEYEGQTPSSERFINLFHCLLELDDHSMAEEIKRFLTTENQTGPRLTAAQCSTLAYIILMSKEVLEELDLNKFNASEEARRRLVPAVRNCRKALMAGCRLTEQCYKTIASALQDPDTPLRELDLSCNLFSTTLLDSLQPGKNKLENLNLSHINLEKTGASILQAVLLGPEPQLHTLKLCACDITDECAEILLAAFQSSMCRLKDLDISYNSFTSTGVELILQGLQSPSCNLEVLRLSGNEISAESYKYLVSALERSFLRELILDDCRVGDEGVTRLCPGLASPHCRLETLGLSGCLISAEGCCSLASALSSNPSSVLRDLDLSYNHPGDEGEKLLSDLKQDPGSKLQTLRMDHGGQSRLTTGLWKYYQELNIDCVGNNVVCSQDRKGVVFKQRDTSGMVSCREKLTGGRFFFEVQWAGRVTIVLKEENGKSLEISLSKEDNYLYFTRKSDVRIELGKCLGSNTFGVYLDWPRGTVSLYSVYDRGVKRFYTFHTTFSEPVISEFWVKEPSDDSDVSSIIIVTPSPDSVQRTTEDLNEQLHQVIAAVEARKNEEEEFCQCQQ